MVKVGHGNPELGNRYARRAFLGLAGASILGIVACGDESSERQFAGDPRTVQSGDGALSEDLSPGSAGSPTAAPTSMPVAELLAPRSDRTIAIGSQPHILFVADVDSGDGRPVWSNSERSIWASAVDTTSTIIALLTSSSESAAAWAVEFVDVADGTSNSIPLGADGDSVIRPDSVAVGRGGIDWFPNSRSVAVSLPTGGLVQVFPDGSEVKLAKAAAAKRPAAISISSDGNTIAFVDQPSGSEGSGIFAGSIKAKPIDPIVVLPADRSGNRYAREIEWIGMSPRVATIVEREELGTPQGDLFYLDTHTHAPQLAWTSPSGRDIASVESFGISPDSLVTAFLTNPSRPEPGKPSSVWLKQTEGTAIERFDLPVMLTETRLEFTNAGVTIAGIEGRTNEDDGLVTIFLLAPNGEIQEIYQQEPPGTPVASPVASPAGSPLSSPLASPAASPSPVAATNEG